MDLQVNSDEASFRLKRAILLYEEDNAYGNRSAFASVHDIDVTDGGEAVLSPGRPATREGVLALAEALLGKQPASFLPEHVLACTADVLVWHVPPGCHPLFFQTASEELNALTGKPLPHPGLVFRAASRGGGSSLHVWAVRWRGRPRPGTPLYHAPFLNINEGGSVCLGSMPKPTTHGPEAAEAWTASFFGSAFTHGGGSRFLRGQPGYASTLRSLSERTGCSFPTDRLVRTGRRLRDVIAV